MTATFETCRLDTSPSYGDKAYEIIDRYRAEVDDHFEVEPLDREFPYLAYRLGVSGLYLAQAAANEAGTFKWRGALVGAAALQEQGAESLIVPSAGNHARGAILAAKLLGMDIHVVVPQTAPPAKKEGLKDLWDSPRLTVHAIGDSFDEALSWAKEHADYGALLHPYDDPHVAAGQGTIADDMLAQQPAIEHIIMPIGGGGLLAGIRHRLDELGRYDITLYAAEAEGSNSLSKSLANQEVTTADQPNRRYGGSAVRRIGHNTLAVCQTSAGIHTVGVRDEEVDYVISEYEQARFELMRESTPHYEPTTLVAVAGLTQVVAKHPHESTVVIGTGHNDRLRPPQQAARKALHIA